MQRGRHLKDGVLLQKNVDPEVEAAAVIEENVPLLPQVEAAVDRLRDQVREKEVLVEDDAKHSLVKCYLEVRLQWMNGTKTTTTRTRPVTLKLREQQIPTMTVSKTRKS